MFIGHIAVGLAAKKVAPGVSLGTTFMACQAADLLWPVLVLAGVERVSVDPTATVVTPFDFEYYPWSHSLVMSLVWSLAAFALSRAFRFSRREAATLGVAVFSHWILDVATHRPDIPLWLSDGSKVGLGLWNSTAGTLIVELAMFGIGVGLYLGTTRAENRKGSWGLWGLVSFLLVVYFGNVFGPAPAVDTPSALLAGPALALWLLVAWAYWVDRNRSVRAH